MSVLQGISPWWWVALAILLAAVEMVTITTVLIWSSLAAFVTALVLWATPGMGGFQQIGLFGVLSIVFFFAGRWAVDRFGQPGGETTRLNERAQALVGRDAEVLNFSLHEGKVVVDGIPWPARLEPGTLPPSPGDHVRIVATDGITMVVRPLP